MRSFPPLLGALVGTLADQRARLGALARRASAGGDEELLHDVRVALRRTATVARVTRRVLGPWDGDAVRERAGTMRRSLSPLRTAEVCRAFLSERFAEDPVLGPRARRLALLLFPPPGGGRPPIRASDLHALARLLRDRQAALVAVPARDELEREIEKRVGRRVESLEKELRAVLPPTRETVHAARIAAKGLRYALEFAGPFVSAEETVLPALRTYQDVAGTAHDRLEVAAAVRSRHDRARGGARARLAPLLPPLEEDLRLALEEAIRKGEELRGLLKTARPRWRGPAVPG